MKVTLGSTAKVWYLRVAKPNLVTPSKEIFSSLKYVGFDPVSFFDQNRKQTVICGLRESVL
jgi:hypothetical protein